MKEYTFTVQEKLTLTIPENWLTGSEYKGCNIYGDTVNTIFFQSTQSIMEAILWLKYERKEDTIRTSWAWSLEPGDYLAEDTYKDIEHLYRVHRISEKGQVDISQVNDPTLIEQALFEAAAEAEDAVASFDRHWNVPRQAFIGRWQPFHLGHETLIRWHLNEGTPCLVLVRDIPPDENNPYTTKETIEMIHAAFYNDDVRVQAIPDIAGINWGRGVGYETNEIVLPEDVQCISATEIRKRISNHDDSWKEFVNPRVAEWLKEREENG